MARKKKVETPKTKEVKVVIGRVEKVYTVGLDTPEPSARATRWQLRQWVNRYGSK